MHPDEIKKRMLRFQCRRGMLELDMLLATFFDQHFDELSEAEQTLLAHLLDQEDTLLWSWFMESQLPEGAELRALVERIAKAQ